ncbi:MAG: FHA domain-containing protein, partial [Planctomycetaceae bacterium]
MRDFSALLPPNTVACLKLANDGRRFPFRPLTAGHCLIGSGAACDLRLGETGVPSLHSSIELNGNSARITLLASAPSLCINGQTVSGHVTDFSKDFSFGAPG